MARKSKDTQPQDTKVPPPIDLKDARKRKAEEAAAKAKAAEATEDEDGAEEQLPEDVDLRAKHGAQTVTDAAMLREALRVAGAVSDKVLLRTDEETDEEGESAGENLILQATSGGVFIELALPTDGPLKDAAVVDRRSFEGFVKGDDGEEVGLAVEKAQLRVIIGTAGARLTAKPAADFAPPFLERKDWPEKAGVKHDAVKLHHALTYCLAAAGAEGANPREELAGVCFDGKVLVATDGHRIHLVPGLPEFGKWARKDGVSSAPILPVGAAKILHRLTNLPNCKVVESYMIENEGKSYFLFLADASGVSVSLECRAHDGHYVPYESALPQKGTKVAGAKVKREELLAVIARAAIVCSTVRLSLTESELVVATVNADEATFREAVPVDLRDGAKEAASGWWDASLLKKALKPMLDPWVSIGIPLVPDEADGKPSVRKVLALSTPQNMRGFVAPTKGDDAKLDRLLEVEHAPAVKPGARKPSPAAPKAKPEVKALPALPAAK